MSASSKGTLVDRLDHEIRCLEAIDAGLQGLAQIDVSGSEADFAHLVQDRIDRLREIRDEIADMGTAVSGGAQ
jgi:nitrogen-specific signal transduction histidine kinase